MVPHLSLSCFCVIVGSVAVICKQHQTHAHQTRSDSRMWEGGICTKFKQGLKILVHVFTSNNLSFDLVRGLLLVQVFL
jgi:hypothetical protein